MPNPGTFRGSRKEFLISQKEVYAVAVRDNYEKEALSLIQRKYFKRFPIDLPHDQEPAPEFLALVNDDDPDPERPPPYADGLSEDGHTKAMEEYEARQKLIQLRKSQIKRWLHYQYMKDHHLDSKDSGENNPFRALLQKLSGRGEPRPRRKTAANIWRRSHRDDIEKRVKIHASANGLTKKHYAALRDRFAREMFSNLPEEQQKAWSVASEKEYDTQMEQWRVDNDTVVSTLPEDRQRAIQGLPSFSQLILDLMAEVTGWKLTLLAGGPEPAHDGKLNMISIHSGTIPGDVKMNFGTAERARYKQYFVPIFGSFLRKCYTPEECRSRALRTGEEELTLSSLDLNDNVNIDVIHCETSDKTDGSSHERASPPPPYVPDSENASAPATKSSSNSPFPPPGLEFDSDASDSTPATSPFAPPGLVSGSDALDFALATSPLPLPGLVSCPNSPDVTPEPSPRTSAVSLPMQTVVPTATNSNPATINPNPPPLIPATSIDETMKSPHTGTKRTFDAGLTEVPRDTLPFKRARVEEATQSTQPASDSAVDALSNVLFAPAIEPTSPDEPSPPASLVPSPMDLTSLSTTKGVPPWLQTGLETLQSHDLGPSWKGLVAIWFNQAKKDDIRKHSPLPAKERPMEVGVWMKRHRASNYRPVIDRNKYSKAFIKWYTSIQPTWRVTGDTIDFSSLDGDWECFRKSGPNGTLVIMIALFYWGIAEQAEEEESTKKDWLVYIEDCYRVFTMFLKSST